MNAIAAVAVILLELVLLVSGLAYWFYRRGVKARARLKATETSVNEAIKGRRRYLGALEDELSHANRLHLERAGEDVQKRGANRFDTSLQPVSHLLRLHYGHLKMDQSLLGADLPHPDGAWGGKADRLAELRRMMASAMSATEYWDTVRKSLEEERAKAESRVRQLQQEIVELKERFRDVRPYRNRFNDLHKEVRKEREASREMQESLSEHLGEAVPEVRRVVDDYKERTGGLDEVLDQPDVRYLNDYEDPTQPKFDWVGHWNKRQNRVFHASNQRVNAAITGLKAATDQQQQALESLPDKQASQEDHVAEISASLEQSAREIAALERENRRRERIIGELTEKLNSREKRSRHATDLEKIVDRYARQAMEMTQRLQQLEDFIERNNLEIPEAGSDEVLEEEILPSAESEAASSEAEQTDEVRDEDDIEAILAQARQGKEDENSDDQVKDGEDAGEAEDKEDKPSGRAE